MRQVTPADVERAIDEAAAMGLDGVVLSGGEPTMRRELPRWVARARRAGLRCGLVTNGRVLSHRPAFDRLVAAGVGGVTISLHGPQAVHDAMTRAASFRETLGAVEAAVGGGLATTVVCVVTRANLGALRDLVDRLVPLGRLRLVFSLVEPEGAAARDHAAVVPDVAGAASAVAAAIAHGRGRAGRAGPDFVHAGLPHCLLPGLEEACADRRAEGLVLTWSGAAGSWEPLEARERVYPPECGDCPRPGRCPGLHGVQVDRDGVPSLRPPPPAPRANSFNYEPVRPVGDWDGACPVVDRPGPWWDRGRSLLLAHAGRLLLCRAETRDFADGEIARTRCDLGQIYLDVSRKAAPDDFAADLRQLRPSARCATCPTHDRCSGCHEAAAEDVFTRDDRRVRDLVAALEGRVLDVGCGGDARYADVLAPLVRAGTVAYLGIDPDPRAVAALGGRGWARARVGTLEGLDGELDAAGVWDHLLLLRAFNHLHDVPRALAAAARALRAGGQLLVVDNVPFGLVRLSPPPPAGAPPRHEHYRNASSVEAIPLIEPHGFRLVEHLPVRPGGSDQWLARFVRE
ncbi:MAG: radical SAM protein [Deltaproteobacteria bacterium]|nr:radical SAM protein [Deltaproteobacteria bacterium]